MAGAAEALYLAAEAAAATVVLAALEVPVVMAAMVGAVATVVAEAAPLSSLPLASLRLTDLSKQLEPPGRAALQVPSVGLPPQAAMG